MRATMTCAVWRRPDRIQYRCPAHRECTRMKVLAGPDRSSFSYPDARALAYSPDGRLLACSRSDGSVALWDTDGWTLRGCLRCFTPGPWSTGPTLAFAPSGRWLATGGKPGEVLWWEPAT